MKEQGYAKAHLSEIRRFGGRTAVRQHFDIEAFGVNVFSAGAGETLINDHTEERLEHEELYVVLTGRATFTVAGRPVEAPAETAVFVKDPRVRRSARAEEADTSVLVLGAKAGEAFTPSEWEATSGFWPLYEAGDYEGAIAYLQEQLSRRPDAPGILYNLACCESLAGRREDALAHLGRAIELGGDSLRFVARDDADFASLREDDDFRELVGDGEEAPAPDETPEPESSDGWRAASLSELPELPGNEGSTWITVRRAFDGSAFGVNVYRANETGGRVIEDHDELGLSAGRHEELYLVLDGHARFTVADETIEAPAGTAVFVRDPAVRRGALADEAGTTVLVAGGKRGEPFEVSTWEDFAGAFEPYRDGDYARAIELFQEALERHPGNPNGLYNLACCESLAGEHEAALDHLEQAVAADERFRAFARDDEDFDLIRNDPRFASLIAGQPDTDGTGA